MIAALVIITLAVLGACRISYIVGRNDGIRMTNEARDRAGAAVAQALSELAATYPGPSPPGQN